MTDKPRYRIKAKSLTIGRGVPDDARPGDLVVGNRGAAALVMLDERLRVLWLNHVDHYSGVRLWRDGTKMYDFR